jgi:hypothetical protein
MNMKGEIHLTIPREVVWSMLNDHEVLKRCIPGCESLERLSQTELQAVATNKVGPVKARFKGRVQAPGSRSSKRLPDLGRGRWRPRGIC